ncbi:MAG: hypothetical protein PHF57_10115 [Methanoregula sp.]|nr:hypothetical protein [Methanoregula sp.]
MDKKNISFLLSLYLAVFLSLLAAGFLFAFIINWEDWFFGIKLDGLPAGIYLFSKAVVAALLAYLLLKCKTKQSMALLRVSQSSQKAFALRIFSKNFINRVKLPASFSF